MVAHSGLLPRLTLASRSTLLCSLLAGGGCAERVVPVVMIDLSAAADLAPDPTCRDDSDCIGDPGGPRCDSAINLCVACLPIRDNCPPTSICQVINGVWTCRACDCSPGNCNPFGGNKSCCSGCFCTNLDSDARNCGACDHRCDTVAHGSPGCAIGSCIVAACDPGWGDCNRLFGDGCEITLATDPRHCGQCGNACPQVVNGQPGCADGVCTPTCDPRYGDCDGRADTGCETDLSLSVDHCGKCGRHCTAPPNGTARCEAADCVTGCLPDFADCDHAMANGCETDLRTGANCGACARACGPGQSCVKGVCQ